MRAGVKAIVCAAVAQCVLAACAGAAAAATYEGRTSQDRKVVLTTDRDDRFKRIAVFFDADCESKRLKRAVQGFRRPMDELNTDGFRDADSHVVKLAGGSKAKVRASIKGRRLSPTRFKGTLKVRVRFFTAGGRRFNACRTPNVGWSVTRQVPTER